MQNNGLKRRLEALEALCHDKSLYVLAKLPDGIEAPMSVPEMLSRGGQLVRVISGNSLSDLDLILDAAKKAAFEESEE